MTKGELRAARKAARAAGTPYADERRDDATDTMIFSETGRGRGALDRWARRYDELNGAPESEEDR